MDKYTIEVKHFRRGRKWQPLSVAALSPFPEWEVRAYCQQWALDRQLNPDSINARVIMGGEVFAHYPGDAAINAGEA